MACGRGWPTRPFPHIRHAQIARRATLSHVCCIVEIGKSEIDFPAARLATRDVTANRHETRGGLRWTPCVRNDEARTMRSTKPCGPDTPMLVSSSQDDCGRR